jgi:hypothetical protein
LNIVIQSSPLRPPLLDVNAGDASTVLFYDAAGDLIYFMMVIQVAGQEVDFITADKRDANFFSAARNAGLKLKRSK